MAYHCTNTSKSLLNINSLQYNHFLVEAFGLCAFDLRPEFCDALEIFALSLLLAESETLSLKRGGAPENKRNGLFNDLQIIFLLNSFTDYTRDLPETCKDDPFKSIYVGTSFLLFISIN